MTIPWILPLQAEQAASEQTGLAIAGGKGANLARLALADFPVPGGFLITTQAYRDFVAENRLDATILAACPADAEPGALDLEAVSAKIRTAFSSGRLPDGLAEALCEAYLAMHAAPGAAAVAVRSSATAEDLPEMSFAGQQDTFLNIVGEAALRKAVIDCWSSLWTARAIGYRARNHVSQQGAALAVVVQRMVESQASGVLFTANPLTGVRTQTVIDATLGLGEALVSGQVEPDHYVVAANHTAQHSHSQILEKTLGAKALSIHGQAGGGTAIVTQARSDQQALPDTQILELAELGQRVAAQYGVPQDIEWAWADGRLYLLQSRAITSLFPTPAGMAAEPLKVLFSFAAIQGLLDPITPLGRDLLKTVFAVGQGLFGYKHTAQTQTILWEAGERLWVNFTTLIRNSVGRKIAMGALSLVEPTIRQALGTLLDDPRLQPDHAGIRPRAMSHILRFAPRMGWNMLLNLRSPRQRREAIIGEGEQILALMRERAAAVTGSPRERLAQVAELLPNLAQEKLPRTLLRFVSIVATGMASYNAINQLTKDLPDGDLQRKHMDLLLELTRGLPNNPTTEMDLDLWRIARAIQHNPLLKEAFSANQSRVLAERYLSGQLASAGQALIDPFMQKYGGRGLAEIDMGRPRWREDPTHIFDVLSSYLQIEDSDQAPDVVFARSALAAQSALEQLAGALRKTHGGWFKVRLLRFFSTRMRELMGARESPKFFAVRMFGLLRVPLLSIGADLVRSGELTQADDLFYLTFEELKAFARGQGADWQAQIHERRDAYRRESLRRQIPRLLLSDGQAFYEGLINTSPQDGRTLNGSPVSPGSTEGSVRVVLDPRQANLKPGEILVCPGTDPSWTPLFLSAGGLIMEVGGMMTHGAVVAREYGIPAIVGVDQATHRLQTGQRIKMDGSTGLIELLEEEAVA